MNHVSACSSRKYPQPQKRKSNEIPEEWVFSGKHCVGYVATCSNKTGISRATAKGEVGGYELKDLSREGCGYFYNNTTIIQILYPLSFH